MQKNKNTVKAINRNVRSSPRKINLLLKNIRGKKADVAILDFIKENRSIVATMDKELKNKIKQSGSSILSIHNDKIVLEN